MELATYLAELRRVRGVSAGDWAATSGVNRATLWRWLKGKTAPREVELNAALTALSVTVAERKRAFALLAEARGGFGIARITPLDGIPVIRHDLLRALRVRNGWTQEEAAARCGVSQVSLSRWESGERWLDGATLHTITRVYGALPEEIAVLTTAPGDITNGLPDLTSGDFTWHRGDFRALEMLILAQIGRASVESQGALEVREARLRLVYSSYLNMAGRHDNARREQRRLKDSGLLSRDAGLRAGYFWEIAGIAHFCDKNPTLKDCFKILTKVVDSPSLSPVFQARLHAQRVSFLYSMGDVASAHTLWNECTSVIEAHQEPELLSWYRTIQAKVLTGVGDFDGALAVVAGMDKSNSYAQIFQHKAAAQVFVAANSKSDAIGTYREAARCAADAGVVWHKQTALERVAALENNEPFAR